MTTELEVELEMALAKWRRERDRAAVMVDSLHGAGLASEIPLTRYLILSEHIKTVEDILGYE